jgi:hypothetical protein
MTEPWLTTEKGKKRAPNQLIVRTPATVMMFGDDQDHFAADVGADDAASPTIRSLGIRTDPQVSEVVEQISLLRDSNEPVDERALMPLYAVISAACKVRDPAPDDMIGDLSLRKLQARFGRRGKPGLIFVAGRWLPPAEVFLGKAIFGDRRPFVSGSSTAERLWRSLKIKAPSISDCLEVITEIAQAAPDNQDAQVLANVYLYIEEHIEEASKAERLRLQGLPLWTLTGWRTQRPTYLSESRHIADGLSSHLAVWDLALAPTTVPRLIEAAGASLLTGDDFDPVYHERALIRGAALEERFATAIGLLSDWLTRHDPKLFEACSAPWADLSEAQLAIDEDLQLALRLGRQSPVLVPARAHVTRSPLTFYFAGEEAVGESDAGAGVIASLFAEGDRDKLALAWSDAWHRSTRGETGSLTITQDTAIGVALDELLEQASGMTPIPPTTKRGRERKAPSTATPPQSTPVRRLKRLEDLTEKTVSVGEDIDVSEPKSRATRGLSDDLPRGSHIGSTKPVSSTAPRAYSDEEKEDHALRVLQLAVNGHTGGMRDYRHLRGIGADAVDRLRRFFEIKATFGQMPDTVTLTPDEAQRAFRESEKFFLAVVAGLEEGYETVVKIFPNPLRTLELRDNTSVTLGGVRGGKAALEVRFP